MRSTSFICLWNFSKILTAFSSRVPCGNPSGVYPRNPLVVAFDSPSRITAANPPEVPSENPTSNPFRNVPGFIAGNPPEVPSRNPAEFFQEIIF